MYAHGYLTVLLLAILLIEHANCFRDTSSLCCFHSKLSLLKLSSTNSNSNGNAIVTTTTAINADANATRSEDSTLLAKRTELENSGPRLSALLDKMPTADKYNILLQSYATSIRDDPTVRNNTLMDTMEGLYIEMMQKSCIPTAKSTQYMIDAAATFASTFRIGKSLQLGKAGGTLKAFGISNGQLTDIITSGSQTKFIPNVKIPSDDREKEILSFLSVSSVSAFWLILEVLSVINDEIKPWATLLGCAGALSTTYDIIFNKSLVSKSAMAGFDRLILRDAERESYCDSSSFLVGYLLGLPCFPYQPDVVQALKMLIENPASLDVYKQPLAISLKRKRSASISPATASTTGTRASDAILSLFGVKSPSLPISQSTSNAAVTAVEGSEPIIEPIASDVFNLQSPSSFSSDDEALLNLGRVLIWLFSPVVAESLRYGGQTLISDPRRCDRLLSVLEDVQKDIQSADMVSSTNNTYDTATNRNNVTSSSKSKSVIYQIPKGKDDREALLRWAYYEAEMIVKLFGETHEELKDSLLAGTVTVGECVMDIEEDLR